MKSTSSGFVLYFDDLDVLRKRLDAKDALDVIAALARFAQTGAGPQEGVLSPAAAMAYEMMARRVSKSLMEYADKKAKTRRAARARWDDADACECMQAMQTHASDADACGCMEQKRKEMNKEAVAGISDRSRACARGGGDGNPSENPNGSVEAVADSATTAKAPANRSETPNSCAALPCAVSEQEAEELAAGIPRYQRADELVRRYRLPDSDISRDALLEDIEKHGERAVEDALREASLSNSRPMLSVKYYRKVLENSLARGAPPDAPPGAESGAAPPLYETRDDGKTYCEGMEIVW